MFCRLVVLFQLAFLLGATAAFASPPPTVKLYNATIIGNTNDSETSFTGIPYVQPPVGDLRLRLPIPIAWYNGTINATQPATQCIQLGPCLRDDLPPDLLMELLAIFEGMGGGEDLPQGEDCLIFSVHVPEGTQPGMKLPVIAFIHGGGFTASSSAQFPGDVVVKRSVALGQPVIFAAMNYRLHAFGFLGGKEVKEAGIGNLALHDQREALRWIHKHIAAFGGDPNKVTLWGTSAGAISVSLQMLANGGNTDGLYRGAIMSSGSPSPTGDIIDQQSYYNIVVENAGCANASDTLECLRHVPADTLLAAAAALPNLLDYQGLATPWAPHADGTFLKAPPQHLVRSGSVADVPFITSDVLDEGTLFAVGSFNVTTEEEFRSYVNQFFFPCAPRAALSRLFELYPNDPAQGSPFGTGNASQFAPMFKRLAAFQGDMMFQAPRRYFLDQRSSKQHAWTYISERGRSGGLGVIHGSDFKAALFGPNELTDYIIQFVATQDPNGASNQTIFWPKYDMVHRRTLRILDEGLKVDGDLQRSASMEKLTALSLAFPLSERSDVFRGDHPVSRPPS